MKLKISFIITLCLLAIVLGGCSNKEFNEFITEFDNAYFKVAGSIDITDTLGTLKKLNSDENRKEIDKMKMLLDKIIDKIPKGETRKYDNMKKRYEGVVFLRDAYVKWDKLSVDDKGLVLAEIGYIDMRRTEKSEETK